jgi:hypothetical protein
MSPQTSHENQPRSTKTNEKLYTSPGSNSHWYPMFVSLSVHVYTEAEL